MNLPLHRKLFIALFLFCGFVFINSAQAESNKRVISGQLTDAETMEPIPFATVQITNSGISTLANEDGDYRIHFPDGAGTLKFSHIGYYSELVTINSGSTSDVVNVSLKSAMIDVGQIKVYSRALDPGQRIIVEAIKRKQAILNKLHDYRFDAYTKLVVRDIGKPDSSEIWLMTETQISSFWEQPDKYKEIITARKQTANIKAENNLVTVGNIINFNLDRIDLGTYSIVSPTAKDALDHYNYYLLDTVMIDSRHAFKLEIEPKNPLDPLFVGIIHIADSSYDVLDIDVKFSPGVDLSLLKDISYGQRFAFLENEFWMPIEIRLNYEVDFDIPIPGIPGKLLIDYIASLHNYAFDTKHPDGTFDEFVLEVAPEADDFDSLAWYKRQSIPLNLEELETYVRIDSLENRPKSPFSYLLKGAAISMFIAGGGAPDLFHFNRAEGAYLGFGLKAPVGEQVELRGKTGYAFGPEETFFKYGATYKFDNKSKLNLGFDLFDDVNHRPSVTVKETHNATYTALGSGVDPFDYYRSKGIDLFASIKPFNFSRFKVIYHAQHHNSMTLNDTYSIFDPPHDTVRTNAPIQNGRYRSLEAVFSFDSRPKYKNKKKIQTIRLVQYTRFSAGVEYSSPDFLDNEFDFTRYYVSALRRQRSLGMGVTTFKVYAGISEGDLPPQRYFTVDFGDGLMFNTAGFNTLNNDIFRGDRVLALGIDHNFRRNLWIKGGLPLIKKFPFWLRVFGSVFWTDFDHTEADGEGELFYAASRPYSEVGFGLSNLVPFLAPLNPSINFSWQLSDYDTENFTFMFDVNF